MTAHSAIEWMEWGPEAFERARRTNRPILLGISAVWCHWCHVMDQTTYSDPHVIELVGERFVPVRVDNDRRPDINVRYNMGGWPTTAFLSPNGEILTGATYVPPDDFARMLVQVSDVWNQEREDIEQRIRARRASTTPQRRASAAELDASAVEHIARTIVADYDETHGGFGSEPKFPQADALNFLLLLYRHDRAEGKTDERVYEILARTALAMARGGMYDPVEGGFFRYSTTRDWSIPHFEKMAEDHAGLVRFYSDLYRVSGNEPFAQTVRSALRWLRSVLRNPDSPFFGGSQDADEAYYALPLEERRARQAPFVDRTVYTNWNADLATAFIAASLALDDDTLLEDARATVLALAETMLDEDTQLARHFMPPGGSPQFGPLLADQVALVEAFLDLHAASGEPAFLERARRLCDATIAHLRSDSGGFVDTRSDEQLGSLAFEHRPLEENAKFADLLFRLGASVREERYAQLARETLLSLDGLWQRAGSFAAPYGAALLRVGSEPLTIAIVGEPSASAPLREAALRLPNPLAIAFTLPPDPAVLEGRGYLESDEPLAYICAGTRCAAPARDATTLQESYDALRQLPVR